MEPEGMVHALEIAHRLLKSDGYLIEIHPSSDPPPIVVRQVENEMLVGWLRETDDFIEYEQASRALEEAINQGWFSLDEQGEFIFTTHASSLPELLEFLAAEWKDAVIPPEAISDIEAKYQDGSHEREIIITERILIARYSKLITTEVQ
jgi:hypothetical protein